MEELLGHVSLVAIRGAGKLIYELQILWQDALVATQQNNGFQTI
jgi:hypothetical protein